MRQEIIEKCNIRRPRYSSYPTTNNFVNLSETEHHKTVEQSNFTQHDHLSFYIHIPFCKHLCYFCGCNSRPMGQTEVVAQYTKALHREIDLLLPRISKNRRISQIHYRGESPISIPLHYLREINEHLLSSFATIGDPQIAIECHPGYLSEKDWAELPQCRSTRCSLGIHGFNLQVLKIVNRHPPLPSISDIVKILRQSNARINFDFIYGLSRQASTTFEETIERTIKFCPDRLVIFIYGHVPWVNKSQIILEKAGLPTIEEKMAIMGKATLLLLQSGYRRIEINHFAKPDDDPYLAIKKHQIHNNFQGYCSRRTTAQVYAFGVSGILQLETMHAQHTKDIHQCINNISKGKLCIGKGYSLNFEAQAARVAIESLMCNYRINRKNLASQLNRTPLAVRNAASAFDSMLEKQRNTLFSTSINTKSKTINALRNGTKHYR